MEYQNLKLSLEDKIAIITINRPELRNALNAETVKEIRECLTSLRTNEDVLAVIFTGAGEKAFAAGADINGVRQKTFLDGLAAEMQVLYTEVENYDKPTIAAVNGYALGGGCELAMACDIRIASEKAKFGLPELNLGVLPGAGGTQRMTRLIGKGKTKELVFTGDIIDAEEAEKIGLANKVVAADRLIEEAVFMASKMIKKGPLALKLSKIAINASSETDINTGLLIEKLAQSILYTTEDKIEGTSAFLEKRSANFKGK
ncbi:enoyl-CoA hydratase-related protein [Bacillus dakarensis]|uniref:enoyl-CoA hydratase-related protein n=1 Tax=Robertmurraya dakarensis TaxID=1926278 RepID=UPI000A025CC9|nr:enoyl-CoA hydratase-related protein [Bacillus dakarensis]